MDILTSVETLIIPIAVVVCAVLVYIFGFQKTQEPSFEHIAVLQTAKGRLNTTNRPRSTTPQVKANSAKTSNNKVANGQVANVQASPKANGAVKSAPKAKEPSSNKENVRPQQQKSTKKDKVVTKETAEDLESGDWVLAPSRKAKAKKENVAPKSPEKKSSLRANNTNSIEEVSSTATTTTTSSITQVEQTQQQVEEVEPKQVEVVKKVEQEVLSSQPTSSPQQKGKENKKKSSPKVEKSTPPVKKEPKGEGKTVKEVRQQEQPKETPVKEVQASKIEEPKVVEPKNNIAFDEMGDTWEEAKSRGTRRRARKD